MNILAGILFLIACVIGAFILLFLVIFFFDLMMAFICDPNMHDF